MLAREHAGANSNVLADTREVDPLSGNAVLNGIPVRVEAAGAALDLTSSENGVPEVASAPDLLDVPDVDAAGRPAATTAAEGLQGI